MVTTRREGTRVTLYFAFGSNLDLDQMADRCPGYLVVGYAILRDHRLIFRGPSSRRKAGVASVDPVLGSHVPGILFEIDDAGLAVLDRLEGHPHWYRRAYVPVVGADGDLNEALIYRLPGDVEVMAPTDDYLNQIRGAYAHHGLPRGFDPGILEAGLL